MKKKLFVISTNEDLADINGIIKALKQVPTGSKIGVEYAKKDLESMEKYLGNSKLSDFSRLPPEPQYCFRLIKALKEMGYKIVPIDSFAARKRIEIRKTDTRKKRVFKDIIMIPIREKHFLKKTIQENPDAVIVGTAHAKVFNSLKNNFEVVFLRRKPWEFAARHPLLAARDFFIRKSYQKRKSKSSRKIRPV